MTCATDQEGESADGSHVVMCCDETKRNMVLVFTFILKGMISLAHSVVQYLSEGPILNKSMPEFASGS